MLENGFCLDENLLPLLLRIRQPGDGAARAVGGDPSLNDNGADDDGEIHRARRIDIADRAGVDAARLALELAEDLHGALLWGARHGAAGEGGAEGVDRRFAGEELGGDSGDQLVDGGERLDATQDGDRDAAGDGDAAEVVAEEVADHEVFGAVLHGGGEVLG